jgi:hypothetical protein
MKIRNLSSSYEMKKLIRKRTIIMHFAVLKLIFCTKFHPLGILASHLSIKFSVMWRCRYAINKFDFVLGQEIYSAENAACVKNLGVSCLSPRHFPLLYLYLYTHTPVLSDEFIFAQSANGHHRGRIFVAREINPKGEWERNN